jgi:dCMP deaminase
MLQACVASLRSPDPNTQVGCVIYSTDNKPISIGYNGTPRGIHPDNIPWDREGPPEKIKYSYVVHSELNAILNTSQSLRGAICSVTMYPCNECAKSIIQSGISRVYYLTNPYEELPLTKASKWMLETAGVKVEKHIWNQTLIQDNITQLLKTISPE